MNKIQMTEWSQNLLINLQNVISIQNELTIKVISTVFIISIVILLSIYYSKKISILGSFIFGVILVLISTMVFNSSIEGVISINLPQKRFDEFAVSGIVLNLDIITDMWVDKLIFKFFMFLSTIYAIIGAFFITQMLSERIKIHKGVS